MAVLLTFQKCKQSKKNETKPQSSIQQSIKKFKTCSFVIYLNGKNGKKKHK